MTIVTTKSKPKTGKATTRKIPKTVSVKAKTPAKKVRVPAVETATKPTSKPEVATKLIVVTDPVLAAPDLKKKELVDLVVARSGIKKKDAKPVVEAMLAVLGETIASGRELNLQPLGKLRINRSTDKGNGNVIICKLRQSKNLREPADKQLATVSG